MSRARWIVTAGTLRNVFFTHYHAEQMARALTLHGMDARVEHQTTARTLMIPKAAIKVAS